MTSRGTFGVLFPPTDPLPQPQPTRPAPSPATPHPTLPDCADLLVPDLVGVASPPPDLGWLTPGYRNLPPSSSSSPTADWSSRSAPPADANRGASAMAPEWCRIWWPQRRLQPEPLPAPQRFVLFGWLFARTDSVDVVVAAALPQEEILRSFPTPEALQVVLYDVPTACGNHFSLGEDAPCRSKSSFRKPNWINNLECKRLEFDLDPIILGLNCSNAARLSVAQEAATIQVTWHSVGILLASISTIVYIFIQVFQKYLSNIYQYFMLQKVFGHSWKNMHLRCCHILYWPIILQDRSLSSTVNVEYAHKAAIQKHTLWSNIVMDLLTGLFLGVVLLLKTEIICSWTFALVHYMTDSVLRSGCVWLMGVPAGFKLNTELAELLGMISLNAIQIYSTLWSIVGGFLRHIIWGLAFSGILLGLTVPVSFFIDVIQLATLHVTLLQWLISLIYSRQIQTVASLWRLFRVPTTLHLQFSLFPWMHLGIRHYWLLCRDSVLSCAPKSVCFDKNFGMHTKRQRTSAQLEAEKRAMEKRENAELRLIVSI
uniref:Phosphatidylinositol N-acetylglucosaminyltransferase subunit Q n=1 Tax=Oryza barthii TaxID=65489 RepID=A0A0D3G5J5_9ORYZ